MHTLHCIALHYIALHCIAFHYITYTHTYIYIYLFIYLSIYLFIFIFILYCVWPKYCKSGTKWGTTIWSTPKIEKSWHINLLCANMICFVIGSRIIYSIQILKIISIQHSIFF